MPEHEMPPKPPLHTGEWQWTGFLKIGMGREVTWVNSLPQRRVGRICMAMRMAMQGMPSDAASVFRRHAADATRRQQVVLQVLQLHL